MRNDLLTSQLDHMADAPASATMIETEMTTSMSADPQKARTAVRGERADRCRGCCRVALLVVLFATDAAFSIDCAARGFGVNKDAMTMQDCRDRLALPASKRPKADDARIDLDAMCANMLGLPPAPKKTSRTASRPASAASQ